MTSPADAPSPTAATRPRSRGGPRAARRVLGVVAWLQVAATAAIVLETLRLTGPGAPTVPGVGIVGGIERDAAHAVPLGRARRRVQEAWIVHVAGRDFQGEVRLERPPAFRIGDPVPLDLRRTASGTEVVATRPQAAVEGGAPGLHGPAPTR